MSKSKTRVIFMTMMLWGLAGTSYCQPANVSISSQTMDVRLVLSTGNVTLLTHSPDAEGAPVAGDMPLVAGDVIKTGHGAAAEIAFYGETLVHLEERTTVRLLHLSPVTTEIGIERGTLLARVHFDKSDAAEFIVRTPNAIVWVSGTEFVVQQQESQVRVGVLDEGHVRVSKPGHPRVVTMHFNQETLVKRGKAPERPQTLHLFFRYKPTMAEMRQRIKPIRKRWDALTVEQRQLIRDAWIKTHPPVVP